MFKKKGNESFLCQVIGNREQADLILHPKKRPYIKGLGEGISLVKKHRNNHITIIGDYDCDGIGGTVILYHGLRRYGFREGQLSWRIPKRISEGYGLSPKIIDEVGQGLIITVDNGISSIEAIAKARQKGLDVLVIDHHLPVKGVDGSLQLPDADVIIDPWKDDETAYTGYCGAGLAYRFIELLCPDTSLADLKCMAAISTIADVMELVDANRVLVKEGIGLLRKGFGLPGIRLLMKQLYLGRHITEYDIAFQIAPILNAAERMEDGGAALPVSLLLSKYPKIKDAERLIELNNLRKAKVAEAVTGLRVESRPIVVADPRWKEGIVGLIAGRLAEQHYCPVIAFTESPDGCLKGSGRSIPEKHLKDILDSISSFILSYGGHSGAAGIKIRKEDLEAFTDAFKEACGEIPEKGEVLYDLELPYNIRETLEELEYYAPYGNGNPKPVYHLKYHIDSIKPIGDGSHFIATGGSGLKCLGLGLWDKYQQFGSPEEIEVIGYLSENWFKDEMTPQIEIIDFVPFSS